MGIEVMPPDINASGIDFTPKGDRICLGCLLFVISAMARSVP